MKKQKMSKKGQGLPINFIVIAALAILILILAAGFVVAGGGAAQEALGPQQAQSQCQEWCGQMQKAASSTNSSSFDASNYNFCTSTLVIEGNEIGCTESPLSMTCTVTFQDGSSTIVDSTDC